MQERRAPARPPRSAARRRRAGGARRRQVAGATGDGGVARLAVVARRLQRPGELGRRGEPVRRDGARARWMAWSTPSGTSGRVARTLGTGSVNRFAMIACAVGPVNGGSPASIS